MSKTAGGFFAEYPCKCGSRSCEKKLEVTRGLSQETVGIEVRGQGMATVQVYLDAEQVAIMADELRMLAESA